MGVPGFSKPHIYTTPGGRVGPLVITRDEGIAELTVEYLLKKSFWAAAAIEFGEFPLADAANVIVVAAQPSLVTTQRPYLEANWTHAAFLFFLWEKDFERDRAALETHQRARIIPRIRLLSDDPITEENCLTLLAPAIEEMLDETGTQLETQESSLSLNPIDIALYYELQHHPELLTSLDWRKFEELLADILETFGYQIELTQSTKDGGIDIIALERNEEFGLNKYLLQAKRWRHSVGVEPVQRLLFCHDYYRATRSCLATTSQFTKGAWRLHQEYEWRLSLKERRDLWEWIRKALELKMKTSK